MTYHVHFHTAARRRKRAVDTGGGLTGPRQSAMAVLVNSAGMSLKELSKERGLAHSTTSGIVDRLAKQGPVERVTDEADLRLSKVVVSSGVRKYLRETLPALELHPLAEALRAATRPERQAILRGVRALRRVLERRAHKPAAGADACGGAGGYSPLE